MKDFFQVQLQLWKTAVSHTLSFSYRQEMTALEKENRGQEQESKSLLHNVYFTREAES